MPQVTLTGTYRVPGAVERVYDALRSADVLQRCIEGCESLVEVEPGVFDARLRLGLGAIRGRYTGRARVSDEQPPASFTLEVDAKGPAGFVRGTGRLSLTPADGGTDVACEATGEAGGALAAVGSRLIQAAGAQMMQKFFATLAGDFRPPTDAAADDDAKPA